MKIWQLLLMGTTLVAAVEAQGTDCRTPDGSFGSCVTIRQCPELLREINNNRSSEFLGILRKSICSPPGSDLRVCCPVRETTKAELLPFRCGVSDLEDRVFDGEDALLLSLPWMVLLRGRGPSGSNWICGAVLISERYVLTAAHCVHSSSGVQLQFVRIGEHTLSSNPDCEKKICAPTPQDILVEDIKVHEQYGSIPRCPRCHDIALLRLRQPAVLNALHVVPICLPLNLERDLDIKSRADFTSRTGVVAGWGTVDPLRVKLPDVLQKASLPINDRYCGITHRAYPDPDMVLCAGGEKKDTCQGDSGGPLILINKTSRKFVVGIVSQGPVICGAERTQGVYTSVSYYMPWILRNLRQ